MNQDTTNIINTSIAYPSQDVYFSYSGGIQIDNRQNILPSSKNERLESAFKDLQIGRRIQNEIKCQGRTTTWLAQQLGMERTSLYYTFRQNSIDVMLLLRISAFMEHNFLQDVADVFKTYGL